MAKLITESVLHRTVNGYELTKAREAVGLSQFQFAAEAGWSQQYQAKIERVSSSEVTIEVADKIVEVLKLHEVFKKN